MIFNCKKYATILFILCFVIVIAPTLRNNDTFSIKFTMGLTIFCIACIIYSCNNYKLEITDEQITLHRLIGRNKYIRLKEVNKIEIENLMDIKPIGIYGCEYVRLFIYTDAKIYELKLRALNSKLISKYLEKMSPIWGIPFKNKMEDIL